MSGRGAQAGDAVSDDRQTLLRMIHDNVDGIVVVDVTGDVLFANPAAAELFGRSRASLTGSPFGAPITGGEAAEVEIVRADEPLIVEVRSVEIDWNGQPARLVSLRDVTDRKHAEERLEALSDRLMLALESSRLGIWSWTPEGDRLEVDPFIGSLLGRSGDETPETLDELLAVILPDHRERLRDDLEEVFRTGTDFFLEFSVRRADDSVHHLETRGSVQLNAAGDPVRLMGTCWDATERVNLEEQLRQAQKMEAVGHLAGGVAHDFNNILTGISGYVRLVHDGLPDDAPESEDLTKVLQLSNRGAELIQQLLAFSRQTRVEPEELDLDEIVHDTMDLLGRLLGDDIEVRLQLGAPAADVMGDPGRLEQVLVNLGINARDAMPDGGVLTIETGEREFAPGSGEKPGDLPPGSYTYLSISDTGSGMKQEVQNRIFEPFFTTKEVGAGSGLGLSTVFGIVRQHEGEIVVDSTPDEGTRFTVYLPQVPEAAGEPSRPAAEDGPDAPTRSPGDETILVVEDDAAVADVARRVLERRGYRTLVTTDPDDALELFEEHRDEVDLVLIDVVMPRQDGPTIYARIAAVRPEIKVLFMSGYFESQHEVDAPLIEKPFRPEQLSERVREVLDSP